MSSHLQTTTQAQLTNSSALISERSTSSHDQSRRSISIVREKGLPKTRFAPVQIMLMFHNKIKSDPSLCTPPDQDCGFFRLHLPTIKSHHFRHRKETMSRSAHKLRGLIYDTGLLNIPMPRFISTIMSVISNRWS